MFDFRPGQGTTGIQQVIHAISMVCSCSAVGKQNSSLSLRFGFQDAEKTWRKKIVLNDLQESSHVYD